MTMVEKKIELDWETMYYALRAAAESNEGEYTLNDCMFVCHTDWRRAELHYTDEHSDKVFDTSGISIMCCDDAEEYSGSCASIILERYNKWLERQVAEVATIFDATCWEQAEPFYWEVKGGLEEDVFRNCVWGWEGCQYSLQTLLDNGWNYGLDEQRTKELWKIAYWWVAEGCMRA